MRRCATSCTGGSTQFGDLERVDKSNRLFVTVAELFRMAILPTMSDDCLARIPLLPYTKEELYSAVDLRQSQDEQAVLSRLAHLGSDLAGIITFVRLIRASVAEALSALREERRARTNLLAVLTRYKTHVIEGLGHTCCPLILIRVGELRPTPTRSA